MIYLLERLFFNHSFLLQFYNIDHFLFINSVDGNGTGFGNLEIIVNGGKVTSHVSTVEPQKKFSANFIPHEAGRHRIDVKFNGEKIGLARFVEVYF